MFTPEIIHYLQTVRIPLRLACVSPNGWPVALSLWYVYQDGALYCATQAQARVVTCLQHEPRCAFEIAADEPPYCGVRGQALAEIMPASGGAILRQLLTRYVGDLDAPLARNLLRREATEVALRLQPVNLFTWNYSRRMAGSVPGDPAKPCP